MKCQYFHLNKEEVDEVRKVCNAGTYRVVGQNDIPSVIPEKLREKCYEAIVLASSCETGVVYCINLLRMDQKDKAIDQMPFALVSVPNMAASSCLLHHAEYEGRSTYPGDEFWENVNASRIEQYVLPSESPPNDQGPLNELKGSSHEKGFIKAKTVIIRHNNTLKEKESYWRSLK